MVGRLEQSFQLKTKGEKMDINNEVENMNITSWKDADENVKDKMIAEIENSDNGEMIKCNNLSCEKFITKDGGYYSETLADALIEEGLIDYGEEFDEDDYDIIGTKFTSVVAHIHDVEDFTFDRETMTATALGTFTTNYSLYCEKSCATSSYRNFLIRKKAYQDNK